METQVPAEERPTRCKWKHPREPGKAQGVKANGIAEATGEMWS